MDDHSVQESKTSQLDEMLREKLENAVHKQTSKVFMHDIAKIACEHTPIDLAYAASHLPQDVRPSLYENLPNREAKNQFIINTDNETRVVLFRMLGDKELKKIFDKMPPDESAWVLDDMSERRFRKVMELIDAKKAARITEIKKHSRGSAGRLMTSDFFAFQMDMTIKEAAGIIRDHPRIDFTKGIFILNQAGELQGFVPARNMIINDPSLPLRKVMRPVMHKVSPDQSREEVIDLVERYKVSSLPVVDIDNFIVGVITYEDIVEAMEDLTDETMARIAGTGEKITTHEPIFKRFLARSPWLLVTLLAGLVNVSMMSSFEKHFGIELVFLLFFVPLVTGMSGNIGIQCSTVLVRSMAMGMLHGSHRAESIAKEVLTGLFTGAIFGVLCGLLIYAVDFMIGPGLGLSPIAVSVIVGAALIGACFAGTFLGVFSPLFFSRMGIDPAIASGPIVTALNDFLSMTIYFLITWGLHTLFFS